jgi:hypothetical protein
MRNYLLLLIIALVAILNIPRFTSVTTTTIDSPTVFDSLQKTAPNHDSLSFAEYQSRVDSLFALDQCEKSRLANQGSNLYGGFAGFTTISETDSCVQSGSFRLPILKDHYYLALRGYKLKPTTSVSTRNGRFFLKTRVANTGTTNDYMQKETTIRYVSTNDNNSKGIVLLPVSTKQFSTVKILVYLFVAILLIAGIIALIILPLRILIYIARGNAFTLSNIRDLHIIGWSLVALTIIPNLIAIVLSFIFSPDIPGEIYIPIVDTLLNNSLVLIAGLVVLLIASAFKKGYKVQKENSLTI